MLKNLRAAVKEYTVMQVVMAFDSLELSLFIYVFASFFSFLVQLTRITFFFKKQQQSIQMLIWTRIPMAMVQASKQHTHILYLSFLCSYHHNICILAPS